MSKIFKKLAFIGLIAFLLMQFYQPVRNIDYGQLAAIHISETSSVPDKEQNILRTSCYDCHSNYTIYPWYSYIQPARMLIDNHIKEGRENLNFSEWGN